MGTSNWRWSTHECGRSARRRARFDASQALRYRRMRRLRSIMGMEVSKHLAVPMSRVISPCSLNVTLCREDTKTWSPDPVQPVLEGHSDWVRDVAWAPSVGVGRAYLASAGQDKTVYIWTQDSATAPWTNVALEPTPSAPATQGGAAPSGERKFGDAVWRVSWSVSGNVLAVSSGQYLGISLVCSGANTGFSSVQATAKCHCGRKTSRANLRKCLN